MIPLIKIVLDPTDDLPTAIVPNLAAFPHLVILKRLGVCTADGQVPLARVLEWFDRTHDVGAVAASLAIPAEAVAEAIRYADLLTKTSEAPDAGIAADEPVFGGSGVVTGLRDLDDYPRLVRTKDRVVRTAERGIPISEVLDVFGRSDTREAVELLGISLPTLFEALRYAQTHFVENAE